MGAGNDAGLVRPAPSAPFERHVSIVKETGNAVGDALSVAFRWEVLKRVRTGFEARARQAALSLVTIHVIQHTAAVLSVPQRALKVRPARSVRRLRNAGPISEPGVQVPPSPCTSRTRQRALSAIILLVEP
jgi:hypothetical protein